MGISGLLPLLKSIHKPCSLKKFSGQTIGVDAYGWLHRATAACAIELALGKPTTKFVDFCMHRVRMLIHFGVTPYLVFDGDYLPSKAGTEKERREKRNKAKTLGLELLKMGKTSQAQLELQKAVDVTSEMARMLIDELKAHNVQYVVAPYEADSQMVYLERKGIIDGILSEDSDLLVFGAKCLLTKLDKFGDCIEVNRNHFTACREVSLVGWSDADFRRMAMLSGCDYLPGIGNMGLKTAHRMLRKHKTVDRLVKAAQFDGKFKVAAGYLEAFTQAERTFLYQWVFCPISKKLVNLTTLGDGIDISEMPFLGEEVPPDVASGVARGDLHPHTKESLVILNKPKPNIKPVGPSRRASTPMQTPDLKHSKPIDSFFKPRRTPLAELDPNSFTPSPSQRVLLEQQRNSNGWAAVPAPFQPRTSVTSTAPQLPRRVISEPISARRSAPNPSKRQRLCSDKVFDTPGTSDTGITRSKFFEPSLPEPSPSLRPRKKSRIKSSQDFELYSDDSVESAMAEIVDLEEAASQPKKKMRIFHDDLKSTVISDSQSTIASGSTINESQESTQGLTPANSFGSCSGSRTLSSGLSQQMSDFRSKFSYSSSAPVSQITVDSSKSVVGNLSLDSKISSVVNEDTELEDSAWAAMEAEVVVAASDAEAQSPGKATPTRRSPLRGSEDLLVVDSEAESDCSPRKPMFSLGRFAFTG